MKLRYLLYLLCLIYLSMGCEDKVSKYSVEAYKTSRSEGNFVKVEQYSSELQTSDIFLYPKRKRQNILGIGGAFTESSAYLLSRLSEEKSQEIIDAYFSDSGARYSFTRTHINSCDFSLSNYAYDTVPGDTDLVHFNIDRDREYLLPMIKAAQKSSSEGFSIVASPWTAPPWMKDNQSWKGGKLLPEYYSVWANYFSKYLAEYRKEGVDIWGFTVENEPLGNGENWESMHFAPEEMALFVKDHLAPALAGEQNPPAIFVYDQNRDEELKHWADILLKDTTLLDLIEGTAVHWYSHTKDAVTPLLEYTHQLAPQKSIIHSEGCIDAEVPVWRNDDWYWSEEATDWGWDWAPEDKKVDHPKYTPVYRYANDIIECLNHHVRGWIDWNMVLDTKGGPNWANNWCIAPVIVDPETDEVYYTPLYYVMKQFSAFIRPGADKIEIQVEDEKLKGTAVLNPDGSLVVVLLNTSQEERAVQMHLGHQLIPALVSPESVQTLVIRSEEK